MERTVTEANVAFFTEYSDQDLHLERAHNVSVASSTVDPVSVSQSATARRC